MSELLSAHLPVAVLAGGLATRLRPITETIPKILVEVAGRPFAEHQIELLRAHDLTQIVLCVGYLGEMVQQALGDGSRFGVRLQYVSDGPHLLGTGGALHRALPLLGEAFFVLYGDSYLECDYLAVEAAFRAANQPALMTVCRNNNQWDRSNVQFEDGHILRYDKKNPTSAMRHIDYGLGVIRASAFDLYPSDEAFDLADLYTNLAEKGWLAGFEIQQRFYEIGSHAGLEETQRYLETKRSRT